MTRWSPSRPTAVTAAQRIWWDGDWKIFGLVSSSMASARLWRPRATTAACWTLRFGSLSFSTSRG